MSHKDDIKKLIRAHNRRLQILKEQKAVQGVSVDPKIIIEIKDIEEELGKLEAELEEIEEGVAAFPQINSTTFSGVHGKSQRTVNIEQFLAYSFGVLFIVILLIVALFVPEPTPFQYLVFRIVLSVAVAGVAAMIPGFINLKLGSWLRAGGALAVFAVVYLLNPAQLTGVEEPEPFDPALEGESLIIIAKFDDRSEGGIPPGVDPSSTIYDFIVKGIEDTQETGIRVERLTDVVNDSETAKRIGQDYNARMVIWGYYNSLRIQPYIELVGQRTLLGDSVDIATPTPVAFYFLEQAPTKAAYLGMFSLGLTHIVVDSSDELRQAISFFDAAL
jgi:hypothetical protein